MRILKRSHLHDGSLILALLSAYWATPTSIYLGLGFVLAGLALQIWSKAILKRNRSLAADGPYALCRHPFYLGNALFDLGLCVMSGNWVLVALYPPAFYLAYGPVLRREEQRTRHHFRSAHREYCRTTPLFFPFSPRFLRDWRAPLSWKNLLIEKEVSRTIRHACYPVLVLLAAEFYKEYPNRWLAEVMDLIFWEGILIAIAFGISLYLSIHIEKKLTH